jgi:DNA polymerase III sliding clamp (beta) subunit (PCNA family)
VNEAGEPAAGEDYGEFTFRVKPYVLKALAAAAGAAVPGSVPLGKPVLGCYRVRVSHAGLQLAATDMERTVLASTEAVWAGDSVDELSYAQAFIPAKKLQAVLKEAPEESITFEVKKNRAVVSAGSTSWVFALPDSSEYPELLDPSGLDFCLYPREKFLAGLRAVRHAVCRDAGRPMLTQVEIGSPEGSDGFDGRRITASDGTRFARAELDEFPVPMCIPSPVLDDLTRLLAGSLSDEVHVAATEDALVFRADSTVLAVARRSTPFPDMDKQLLGPAGDNDQVLAVDRDELASAVRRVRVHADADTAAIVLVAEGSTVTVVSRDQAGNSASVPVPLAAGWHGKERVLCVNHVFLAEMLAAHPDMACEFRLGKDLGKRRSVVLLEGTGTVQVLTQMASAQVGY